MNKLNLQNTPANALNCKLYNKQITRIMTKYTSECISQGWLEIPLVSKDTETCPLNPKFPKFTFPRNSLILPRMVHIRIKVDLLPVQVTRDSQVTKDHPRLFPGWCTVLHSHTPVQVSRDSPVTTDHPKLIPGWRTVQHSHMP